MLNSLSEIIGRTLGTDFKIVSTSPKNTVGPRLTLSRLNAVCSKQFKIYVDSTYCSNPKLPSLKGEHYPLNAVLFSALLFRNAF